MTTFLNECAFLLQKYGVSYLRGAGTTLLLALVGHPGGLPDRLCGGHAADHPHRSHRDPLYKRIPCGRCGCCCGATSNCSAAPP